MFLAFVSSFDTYFIPTAALEPTVEAGSRVIVDPDRTDPSLGDLVILDGLDERDGVDNVIRRVIGLPGNEVSFRNGMIFVDDGLLAGWPGESTAFDGESFVVGDNEVLVATDRFADPSIQSSELVIGTVRWKFG